MGDFQSHFEGVRRISVSNLLFWLPVGKKPIKSHECHDIVIMITINVGIKVKDIKRQLMNKNQFKIRLFKQVKRISYKKNIPYMI